MPSSIFQGILLLAGLCCLFSGSQAQEPLETDVDEHNHDHQENPPCYLISRKLLQLSFPLYQKLHSKRKDTNILFSPLNIVAAALMFSLGAKSNTHNQILEALNFNTTEMPELYIHECFEQIMYTLHWKRRSPHLKIQTILFIDENLKLIEKYVRDVREKYYATIVSVDLHNTQRAQDQINGYIEYETQGKITGLVKDLETNTNFALINYIIFQGQERNEQFEFERTLKEDFHVTGDMTVKVTMIHRKGRFLVYRDEELSSWIIAQRYMGNVIAYFILPDQGKMKHLEDSMTEENFKIILQILYSSKFLDVYFPEMSISTTNDLKSVLQTLGITQLFSKKADLSGITEEAPLKLSQAVHTNVLTFNHKVTKTSRNADLVNTRSTNIPVIKFNHPFIVLLQDEVTDCIISMGKVVNPIEKN